MCVLVRRNIKNHYTTQPHLDPTQKHRYEVVLKMNVIGTDFLNPECDKGRYECEGGLEGALQAAEGEAMAPRDSADGPLDSPHLRTRTQSEIEDLVKDFNAETRSSSSTSLSELQITSPNPASRQSTV